MVRTEPQDSANKIIKSAGASSAARNQSLRLSSGKPNWRLLSSMRPTNATPCAPQSPREEPVQARASTMKDTGMTLQRWSPW